jgi:1,4-alpha-glucan branching enzyme
VVYQLHVGTFAGGPGDPVGGTVFPSRYVDVANRIAHLKSLGVNAVMLNPITEFPGDQSAGYNPMTNWAPESKYGSPDDLRYLIDFLHRNGIAVLLDIVWNHFDNTDNELWFYDATQVYFDSPQVETPWGSQADFNRNPVRDYFVDSALQWLEEFHFDGFRMDATSYMDTQSGAGWSLMQRFNDELDRRWADKITIAEQLPNNSFVTRPTAIGGAGFDSQYHDAFTDNLRQEILDSGSGSAEMLKIRDIVNGSGAFLQYRYVTNYLELHDEAWPTSGGQRIVKTIDPTAPHDDVFAKGRSKLAQGLVMTAPGVPAMLMGTEWLESIDFGTGSGNRLDWNKKTTYAPIFQYYRRLIGLRRASPALWAQAAHQIIVTDDGNDVIAFRRYEGSRQVVVIANFSNSDRMNYRVGLPVSGAWSEILNSQAAEFDGNGVGNSGGITTEPVASHGFGQSATIDIPRMGLVILAPAGIPVGVETTAPTPGERARLARMTPLPMREGGTLELALPRAEHVRLAIHDVAGREVAVLADRRFEAGAWPVHWDGRDARGARVRPGLYFARLVTDTASDARRIVVTL